MTEKELRNKVVGQAQSWIGCKESNGTHRKIIDLYNLHKPLARGYAVKYTDAWCATFTSAVSIAVGLTDIMPTECGCGAMIDLYKKIGSWQENDAYTPQPGDVVFYDWEDGANYAATDNKGASDHVGIVEKVEGSTITVIEGNKNNAVERRALKVNGRYIRGYGLPKYSSKATASAPAAPTKPEPAKKSIDVIAQEVIDGKWGNGADRKKRLEAAGYNYAKVQQAVNTKVSGKSKKSVAEIAKEVISGKWGNGADRKKRLEAAGYNYNEVQQAVNKLLR